MRELPLRSLLKALTLPRTINLLSVLSALLISKIVRRPVRWGMPYVLTIEPTNCCNLSCPQCDTGAGLLQRRKGFLDMALYEKILVEHHRSLLYLLLYDQGEPLLHPEYIRLVQKAKAHRVCVTCSTNGMMAADKTLAMNLVAGGLDNMIISLDGLAPESYSRYRQGGDLAQVQQCIRNMVAARRELASRTPRLLIQFLVMKHNEHERAELLQRAQAWGVDGVLFKSVQVRNEQDAETFLPQEEKYRRYRRSPQGWLVKGRPSPFCDRLWYSSVVHWDGTIVPCCFDKDNHHVLGHYMNSSWRSIWHGEKMAQFIARINTENKPHICRNCTHGLCIYAE
jgi:radical SAM protein with 4Fe4S-binding SPASM domain